MSDIVYSTLHRKLKRIVKISKKRHIKSLIFHKLFDYFINIMQPVLKLLLKFDVFQMFTNICTNFDFSRSIDILIDFIVSSTNDILIDLIVSSTNECPTFCTGLFIQN